MNKFLIKTIFSLLILVVVILLLLLGIPKDHNHFLCEYDHKVALFQETSQPRIILMGGSSIPYGVDTKLLIDSLHCNVVNFGLYGGIGIRLPMEDGLRYVKKGDLVVVQMEYHNFFNGGNGGDIAFIAFMVSTDWKYLGRLNMAQAWNVIRGAPQMAIGNLKRLASYPWTGYMDTPVENPKYEYTQSGFNAYGDEVSHYRYPNDKSDLEDLSSGVDYRKEAVIPEFVDWLGKTLHQYEAAGARVIMVPPVCVETFFDYVYNPRIAEELHRIGYDFVVEPASMVQPDSCEFNTGYHMNKTGTERNTLRMMEILKKEQATVK